MITVNSNQRRGASGLWENSLPGAGALRARELLGNKTIRSVCALELFYSSSLWKNLDGAGQLSLQGEIRGP